KQRIGGAAGGTADLHGQVSRLQRRARPFESFLEFQKSSRRRVFRKIDLRSSARGTGVRRRLAMPAQPPFVLLDNGHVKNEISFERLGRARKKPLRLLRG